MKHRNDMTAWSEIRCQRDHTPEQHVAQRTHVDLGRPHGYADLCPIPHLLARSFSMEVWNPRVHPVDGGPYCPAHDAVSETIVSHHIWEPRETVIALTVMASAPEGSVVVDMGAQLGWYSLLGLSFGLMVEAWEADTANLDLLQQSAQVNGWGHLLSAVHERIGPSTPPAPAEPRIRFAKIDLEGAEDEAIRVLWPAIEAGMLDFLLMEVSPVFADYYPELAQRILDAGYRAWRLPPKRVPPVRLDALPGGLVPWVPAMIDPHQEDVIFQREGAQW